MIDGQELNQGVYIAHILVYRPTCEEKLPKLILKLIYHIVDDVGYYQEVLYNDPGVMPFVESLEYGFQEFKALMLIRNRCCRVSEHSHSEYNIANLVVNWIYLKLSAGSPIVVTYPLNP